MFHDMVHHPGIAAADLSSVRHIGFAGMSMTSALTKACAEVFEPEVFVNFYGSSEIYSFAACHHVVDKPGCAGRALTGQELRVVFADPDFRSGPDRILPQGEIGEVIAPMEGLDAFAGYWKRPIPTPRRSAAAGTSPETSAISTRTGSCFSSAGSTT